MWKMLPTWPEVCGQCNQAKTDAGEVETKEHVDELFKKRLQFKDVGFPNKYFTKDLPPEERQEQKKLRDMWAVKG